MTGKADGLATRIDVMDDRLTPQEKEGPHGVAVTDAPARNLHRFSWTGYVNDYCPEMKAAITHSELKH
jgi:hypothetical protein